MARIEHWNASQGNADLGNKVKHHADMNGRVGPQKKRPGLGRGASMFVLAESLVQARTVA
jgi:hypothetical protein